MKEIKAILQPFMLDRVLDALHTIEGLPGVTVSDARAISVKRGHYEQVVKTKLEVMVPDALVEPVMQAIQQQAHTGNVGDSINDAPALAQASLGFAMGTAGTDTAIETADVALMQDDLRKIPLFLRLSRKTATVLVQNIVLALSIKAVFFALALAGHATLWMAVFADMGTSLLVVANGLRLLRWQSQH